MLESDLTLCHIFSPAVLKNKIKNKGKRRIYLFLIKAVVGSNDRTKSLLNVPVSFICLQSVQ